MEHSRSDGWKIVGVLLILASPQVRSQQSGEKSLPPQSAGQYTLATCVNEFTPSRVESTKVGYQYWFIDRNFLDGRTVKMSVVKPHAATHEPHRHADDEIFFVLTGTAEVFLNGEKAVLHPYSTFYCAPNSEHGIRNVGDTDLKYLVMKKIEKK